MNISSSLSSIPSLEVEAQEGVAEIRVDLTGTLAIDSTNLGLLYMSDDGPVWFTGPSHSIDDPFGVGADA